MLCEMAAQSGNDERVQRHD